MAPWIKITLAVLLALGVGTGWMIWTGGRRWNRETASRAADLAPREAVQPPVSFSRLDDLPEPVVRFFRWALTEGLPPVRAANIRHEGEFLLDTGKVTRFRSKQVYRVDPPGFVWDARMPMAPLLTVRVRDTYVDGKGRLCAKLLGWITVADAPADETLNESALMRYLAEAVWFPTALLPEAGIDWAPLDEDRALATLSDGMASASLEFRFAPTGEIVSVYSPARGRSVNGEYEFAPWLGEFSNYEMRGGMRIPLEGEVSWLLADGVETYWRGRIVEVEYDTASPVRPEGR